MTPTSRPLPTPDPADRRQVRAAALGDAARLAGAADLLLVHSPGTRRLALSEGLIAGTHWQGPLALDTAAEPLIREALAGAGPVRCPVGERRRVVGPYWADDAVLVSHHDERGSTIVVLAGFANAPSDDTARFAAAAARALFPPASPEAPPRPVAPGHDPLTGLQDRAGWDEAVRRRVARGRGRYAVLLVDAAAAAPSADVPELMRRVAAAVRAGARRGDVVARLDTTEVAVLIRGGDLNASMARAEGVRAWLAADPQAEAVAMGWGAAAHAGAIAHALDVAQAMAAHERRARDADCAP